MILKREWMLLALMAARHAETTRDLGAPTRSRAAFWIIWLTSLSAASSCSWLLARLLYSPSSAEFWLYLQAGWGAGPQPWEGHWGAGGGFEEGGATAQEEGKRPGPWLWQEWPCEAAAGEGGRPLNRLEGTAPRRRGACS